MMGKPNPRKSEPAMYHFSKPDWMGLTPKQVMRKRLMPMQVTSQFILDVSKTRSGGRAPR